MKNNVEMMLRLALYGIQVVASCIVAKLKYNYLFEIILLKKGKRNGKRKNKMQYVRERF